MIPRILAAGAMIGLLGCQQASGPQLAEFDPARMDPPIFDRAHPPVIAELSFVAAGDAMNAILYEAQGRGPHPTAILLHGFPGNERNLDLAQAMRRSGWNVVFFHYRGSWGSEGVFSFGHVLEDVAEVVRQIRAPDFAAAHRIEPRQIALVGHSMGGFAALVSAAELPEVRCVASIAGGNLGGLARSAGMTATSREAMASTLDGWSGPLRGLSGRELIDEVAANLERFDTTTHAEALSTKPVLLLGGALDQVTPLEWHHTPMVAALREAGASMISERVFANGDHSFSGQRIRLASALLDWLNGDCLPALSTN